MKTETVYIIVSLDVESEPIFAKIAVKVENGSYSVPFYRAYPIDVNRPDSNEIERQKTSIENGGYRLLDSKDELVVELLKYFNNIITNRSFDNYKVKIAIDDSFGKARIENTKELIKYAFLNQKFSWMADYFDEPVLISANVNNKRKNYDPILHISKIIQNYSFVTI